MSYLIGTKLTDRYGCIPPVSKDLHGILVPRQASFCLRITFYGWIGFFRFLAFVAFCLFPIFRCPDFFLFFFLITFWSRLSSEEFSSFNQKLEKKKSFLSFSFHFFRSRRWELVNNGVLSFMVSRLHRDLGLTGSIPFIRKYSKLPRDKSHLCGWFFKKSCGFA